VTIEDRLDVLKGRWLVAAQSRKPSGWRRDRFDVAYDEFTEDNLPNRLFKTTVHRLSRWSQWTDTRLRGRSHFGAAKARRHLTQLRAAEVATDSHGCSPIESVSHLCLSVANVPLPGRAKTFAFLFDMNQLFEEFIAEFSPFLKQATAL
jgi:5-methylcytosine-specific restriction endonuclease McrBC regulatory subunit McrC